MRLRNGVREHFLPKCKGPKHKFWAFVYKMISILHFGVAVKRNRLSNAIDYVLLVKKSRGAEEEN